MYKQKKYKKLYKKKIKINSYFVKFRNDFLKKLFIACQSVI